MVELENGYSKPEKKSVITRLAVFLFIVATLFVMPAWGILAVLDAGSRADSQGVLFCPSSGGFGALLPRGSFSTRAGFSEYTANQ